MAHGLLLFCLQIIISVASHLFSYLAYFQFMDSISTVDTSYYEYEEYLLQSLITSADFYISNIFVFVDSVNVIIQKCMLWQTVKKSVLLVGD